MEVSESKKSQGTARKDVVLKLVYSKAQTSLFRMTDVWAATKHNTTHDPTNSIKARERKKLLLGFCHFQLTLIDLLMDIQMDGWTDGQSVTNKNLGQKGEENSCDLSLSLSLSLSNQ